MFLNKREVKTEIKTIFGTPSILISPLALAKMINIINECDKEVGWLGEANRNEENNIIVIHDVHLFHQEVHSTTCEITPEGLSQFGEELLKQQDGMEKWNNIKVWGHSHVNMGVFPSGQDDKQMEVFADHNDWFIRIIANKKDEMKIDFYDYTKNIVYIDLDWEMYFPELFDTKEFIKKEVKEKVKEKSYISPYKPAKVDYLGSYYNNYLDGYYGNKYEKDEEVTDLSIYGCKPEEFFDQSEIEEIGMCQTYEDAEQAINWVMGCGYSLQEKKKIWEDCQELLYDIYMAETDEDDKKNNKKEEK